MNRAATISALPDPSASPAHLVQPRRNAWLPAKLVLSYLIATYLLFLIWPINWMLYSSWDWLRLSFYLALCFILTGAFFGVGIAHRPGQGRPLPVARMVVWGGALSLAFLIPLSFAYTGRGPWEVIAALQDQGRAYEELQQIVGDHSGTTFVGLMGSLLSMLSFAILPLGILHWERLTLAQRGFVIATVFSTLVISILRGTDRESANIIIVGGSAFIVKIARTANLPGAGPSFFARYWKSIALAALFLLAASILFIDRKESRLGNIDQVCAMGTGVCADLNSPAVSWMGDRASFGVSAFVMSVVQGYYGVALAMSQPWESTWGVGHSPMLISISENYFPKSDIRARALTSKIAFYDGWSDRTFWSSMLTWVANDVSFPGTLVVMCLVGLLWGKTWRDAVFGRNDSAAVLFCAVMLILVYLPLNNQLFITLDGYFIFYGWLVIWLARRKRMKNRVET